ncbi:diaminopimelate decarboxylase [Teredinibacter sp. KSP-S5-2]|uniref:diaminopimelate decarboxylase n=1 Tax=Teredinibacter sp. KSP-S5-2 TaxID=3034506 RepID=UPI002934ED77|nr:diaminopimelate decarboxylase [Teredinibacter sp. KSP-S5-2]WNO09000.1 diaminopimelate decarboxylase [Teredinibacter sp. KSP-S5-2]
MQDFTYINNELHAEQCSLNELANTYGTPLYVYSRAAFERHFNDYAQALGDHPGKICYAVKANSNIAVLQVLAKLGAGFDIVSQGELQRVLKAGGDPGKVIFSGVGKTVTEMRFALEAGIDCFNVESDAELDVLSKVAGELGKTARISIRVNPDVDANTHPYISTGLKENKFGVDITQAPEVYRRAAQLPNLNVVGVDCHIGSQLTDVTPFYDTLDRLLALIDELAESGITIEHLDLGGGIGVTYKDEVPPSIAEYVNAVKDKIAGRNLHLVFEPGRSIAANAGVMLTEVLYLKPTEHKNFAIVDAAMNDNIRPSLYSAWQEIKPLTQSEAKTENWDIVGPVCETGDFLAKNRELAVQQGDRLALMSSGAYGFVMSSNYNSRGRAAEILVDGKQHHVIRQREVFDDLIQGEYLPG